MHPTLIERLVGLDLPTLELMVVTGESPDIDLPWRVVPFDRITDGAEACRPRLEPPREPWDDFAVIYTSGTTGPSKGVRLSFASHLLYSRSFPWDDLGEQDDYLLTLPLFHVAGTSVVYAMLDRGGRVVFSAPFHPKTFWDEVRRYRATSTAVMHGMVPFLLAEPPSERDRDNPLRVIYMGPLAAGAGVPRALWREHLHGLRHDRGAVPAPFGSTPDERGAGRAPDLTRTSRCASSTSTTSRSPTGCPASWCFATGCRG